MRNSRYLQLPNLTEGWLKLLFSSLSAARIYGLNVSPERGIRL